MPVPRPHSLTCRGGLSCRQSPSPGRIAALLHDVVEEECGLPRHRDIELKFGHEVANIVKGCMDSFGTDGNQKQEWELRKTFYISRLREEPESALPVSPKNKLYNARAILEDYMELGTEVWKRFKRGRKEQPWYFEELIKVYEARCSNWRIINWPEFPRLHRLETTTCPHLGLCMARRQRVFLCALLRLSEEPARDSFLRGTGASACSSLTFASGQRPTSNV